jgi:hypothetical protein
MATTEHTINDALAEALRRTRHTWRDSKIISSENTGMLKGNHARPDILILEANVSPVVIETEVLPAVTVEPEARSRLGQHIKTTGRTILSAIALRLPQRLRDLQGKPLRHELAAAADIDMALFTGSSPSNCTRWPQSGWIPGSVADLSLLVQSSSVPPDVIDEAADYLVSGVTEAAGLLGEMTQNNAGAIHKISVELCQEDGEQTRRMAATILANAFMFHEILAGGQAELAHVNSIEQLRGSSGGLTKSSVLAEWRKILTINYWPIFDIARRILEVVPTQESNPLIEGLAVTADKLLQNRLMRSHDLTGAVFQRLIVDRKFLAAYYTTPASAALLVGLAVTAETLLPAGQSWANATDVTSLRMADFACGTGTLISSAYHRVSQLHELSGGDAEAIHPQMMANALVGCDVLPAAGSWNLARIADLSLAQVAYQITEKKHIWLPTSDKSAVVDIPLTTVTDIGSVGPIHRDINGKNPDGTVRGPFEVLPIKPNSAPTYPILWAHEAERERSILFDADCEGIPRQGTTASEQVLIDQKLTGVWATASYCHFNCDFRFNSQATGMQLTPRKTIGGRAWLSIQLTALDQEKTLVLWSNTSLGLLLRWWHSNKQQAGRGNIGKQTLQTLPILDVTALPAAQLNQAVQIFDAMCRQEMLPIHQIDIDPVRKELDNQFARRVLGLPEPLLVDGGPLELLRLKLSREPSIRGNK